MGSFGWRSGSIQPQNLQSGSFTIDTDANGDGTKSVTFKKKMKNAPIVVLTSQESMTTGVLAAYNITTSGFTARADNFSGTASDITVGYIAMDDTRP